MARITRLHRPLRRLLTVNNQELVMELEFRGGLPWMRIRRKGHVGARGRWRRFADVAADAFFIDLSLQPNFPELSDAR